MVFAFFHEHADFLIARKAVLIGLSELVGAASVVALTLVLQDPIQWLLARVLGKLLPISRQSRSVKGLWLSVYKYQSEKNHVSSLESQIVELRQYHEYVWGRNLTGTNHFYELRARLRHERILTGEWENISDRDLYHGSLQVVLNAQGNCMEGKWIGFNDKQSVRQGDWTFQLLTPKLDKLTRRSIVDEWLIKNPQAKGRPYPGKKTDGPHPSGGSARSRRHSFVRRKP